MAAKVGAFQGSRLPQPIPLAPRAGPAASSVPAPWHPASDAPLVGWGWPGHQQVGGLGSLHLGCIDGLPSLSTLLMRIKPLHWESGGSEPSSAVNQPWVLSRPLSSMGVSVLSSILWCVLYSLPSIVDPTVVVCCVPPAPAHSRHLENSGLLRADYRGIRWKLTMVFFGSSCRWWSDPSTSFSCWASLMGL